MTVYWEDWGSLAKNILKLFFLDSVYPLQKEIDKESRRTNREQTTVS